MIDSSSTGHASYAQYDPSTSILGTPSSSWLIDSGAFLHMILDAAHLTSCNPAPHITHVRIANGTPLSVFSISHLSFHSFSVPNNFYISKLSMHLMFVSQIIDFDY